MSDISVTALNTTDYGLFVNHWRIVTIVNTAAAKWSCFSLFFDVMIWFLRETVIRLSILSSDLLGAEAKHGLKAEAMRELGNVQYSVKNVRFVRCDVL